MTPKFEVGHISREIFCQHNEVDTGNVHRPALVGNLEAWISLVVKFLNPVVRG